MICSEKAFLVYFIETLLVLICTGTWRDSTHDGALLSRGIVSGPLSGNQAIANVTGGVALTTVIDFREEIVIFSHPPFSSYASERKRERERGIYKCWIRLKKYFSTLSNHVEGTRRSVANIP